MSDHLTNAINVIISVTPETDPWTGRDFSSAPGDCHAIDDAVATILNAVVAGDLVPARKEGKACS